METVIAGFSTSGLSGLTAVDHLVTQRDHEETGHVAIDAWRSIPLSADGRSGDGYWGLRRAYTYSLGSDAKDSLHPWAQK